MLKAIIFSTWLLLIMMSCSTTTYVVRHAEKSISPKENPVLTSEGELRAGRLKDYLENKKLEEIYSTNTNRTLSTANPTAKSKKLQVSIYDAKNQTDLLERLQKSYRHRLIVGHSNTIRYFINGLAQKEHVSEDLKDHEYDNIFIIKRSKLLRPRFKRIKF